VRPEGVSWLVADKAENRAIRVGSVGEGEQQVEGQRRPRIEFTG